MTPTTLIALWGAFLSSALFLIKLFEVRSGLPRLIVDLRIAEVALSGDETNDDKRLLRVENSKSLPVGVGLSVEIANAGGSALQVDSLYFEYDQYEHHVVAVGLPAILEPRTKVRLAVQPEWAGLDSGVLAVGALDALGSRHPVKQEQVGIVATALSLLPLRVNKFKRRPDTDPRLDDEVVAFQAHDEARLVRKAKTPS